MWHKRENNMDRSRYAIKNHLSFQWMDEGKGNKGPATNENQGIKFIHEPEGISWARRRARADDIRCQ